MNVFESKKLLYKRKISRKGASTDLFNLFLFNKLQMLIWLNILELNVKYPENTLALEKNVEKFKFHV